MIERLHDVEKETGILRRDVDALNRGEEILFRKVEKIGDDLGKVKVEVAKVVAVVGLIQIIATGVIVWALTKGKEEKHAARQVHQTEVRNVVGGPLPAASWRPD